MVVTLMRHLGSHRMPAGFFGRLPDAIQKLCVLRVFVVQLFYKARKLSIKAIGCASNIYRFDIRIYFEFRDSDFGFNLPIFLRFIFAVRPIVFLILLFFALLKVSEKKKLRVSVRPVRDRPLINYKLSV